MCSEPVVKRSRRARRALHDAGTPYASWRTGKRFASRESAEGAGKSSAELVGGNAMRTVSVGRCALIISIAAALLAGCGGSAPATGSRTVPQARRATSSENKYVFVTNDTSDYAGGPAEVDYWPAGTTGNVAPTGVISGSSTGLAMPLEGIVVDSTGEVYVADQYNSVILGFAPNSNGDVAPNVSITGPETGLTNPTGLALDGAGDLYVANSEWPTTCHCKASIEEFAAGANGNVAPLRTISGRRADLIQPQGIAVAGNGEIYVADVGKTPVRGLHNLPKIEVFSRSASGNVFPIRTIIGPRTRLRDIPEGLAVSRYGAYTGMWNKALLERFSLKANGDSLPRAAIEGGDTDLVPAVDGVTTAPDGSVYAVDRGAGSGQLPEILQFSGLDRGNAKPVTNITGSSTRLFIPLFVFVGEQSS